jgi:VWFA-related protein
MKFLLLLCVLCVFCVDSSAQYVVNVQVVDLQISVIDKQGNFLTDLAPEDFLVTENNQPQQVLDLELKREPFSIGVLIDTSSSMKSVFRMTERSTRDFLSSLKPDDEYFIMTFDDRVATLKELTKKSEDSSEGWKDLRYGDRTRLYDGLTEALQRLGKTHNTRRALFLISDGVNTSGSGSLEEVIELAQKEKVLIYSLIFEGYDADYNSLRTLSERTGGTFFILFDQFPRLQAAYEKIAADLAHRFTLFYRSTSDYSRLSKPEISVRMKDPALSVRFQRAYYPD